MFYIRADGNAKTGAGHIMRCLTIAEEIHKWSDVTFLCADSLSAEFVESYGEKSIVLKEAPFSAAELEAIRKWISENGTQKESRLLIDSYLAGPEYVGAAKEICYTAYMDDMCRQVYPADGIVNYNAFAKTENYLALYGEEQAGKTEFMTGCRFLPIRKQFIGREYEVKSEAHSILITTGGGDADNLAGKILAVFLKNNALARMQFHVVSGAFNPHYAHLMQLSEKYPNIAIHKNVKDMASLMCECDVAITAGGTTIYELCAIGVPFVCFSYADNQDALVSYIGQNHIAYSAGSMSAGKEYCDGVLDAMEKQVVGLVESVEKRKECCESGKRLVDGRGAARLAAALCGENRA